jgi:hypothetical protein
VVIRFGEWVKRKWGDLAGRAFFINTTETQRHRGERREGRGETRRKESAKRGIGEKERIHVALKFYAGPTDLNFFVVGCYRHFGPTDLPRNAVKAA